MMFSDGELVKVYPQLIKFAITLVGTRSGDRYGDRQRAQDLTHDAIAKMVANRASFERGTSLFSWGCRIAQNLFYDGFRAGKLDLIDCEADCLAGDDQHARLELQDALNVIGRMNGRGQAVLAFALGDDYEQISLQSKYEVGTIKSRINRARQELADFLDCSAPMPVPAQRKKKMTREEILARDRERKRAKKEAVKTTQAAYREANREREAQRRREHRQKNREHECARRRAYYAENAACRERSLDRVRAHRQKKKQEAAQCANV